MAKPIADKIENIYILDEQLKAVAVLNPELPNGCPFFNDLHTERLEHGYSTLEFEVPASHPVAREIVTERYVVYPGIDGERLLFKIMKVTETNRDGEYRKSVYAENSAVSDLLGNVVRPATLSSYTLEQALNYVLTGSTWQVGAVEYVGVQDIKFDDYTNSLNAVHQILDAFDAEILFTVEFNGLMVTRKLVNAVQRRGSDIYTPFEYSLNLVGVEREEDTTELVTALVGVGKGNSDGEIMTFRDITPTGYDTNRFEKVDDWVGDKEALQRWGINGKHRFDIYKDDKATNPYELFQNTLNELIQRSTPKINYKVDVILLADMLGIDAYKVRLGDTVIVKDLTFQPELILEARIIEYKRSLSDPTKNQVTLGNYYEIGDENMSWRVQEIQNELRKKREMWEVARQIGGSGAHVVANAPIPRPGDNTQGDYYQATPDRSRLKIVVTENIHLAYVTVYCRGADAGKYPYTVRLLDINNNELQRRDFSSLVSGENKLYLDFVLLKDVGTYWLESNFAGYLWSITADVKDANGNFITWDSGSFKIVDSGSPSKIWHHFHNLIIGGAGVTGGYGSTLTVGGGNNQYGQIVIQNDAGESIFVADKDQVTVSKLVAGDVTCPTVANVSSNNVTYYVDPVNGSDENDGLTSSTAFKSWAKFLSITPNIINGQITVNLLNNITEDLTLAGFVGTGSITIDLGNHTMIGTLKFYANLIGLTVKNGTIVAPSYETRAPVQAYKTANGVLQNVTIVGSQANTSYCVQSHDGSNLQLISCKLYYAKSGLIKVGYSSTVYIQNCQGSSTGTTSGSTRYIVETLGRVGIYDEPGATQPYGGDAQRYGGQIMTYNQTNVTNTVGTPPSTVTTPTTVTFTSIAGDSWRTPFNSWRNDGIVRQGQWLPEQGHHTGCWFFGTSLSSAITGKNISKIEVTLSRLSTDGFAKTTFTIWAHPHDTKPTGAPTRLTTASLDVTFNRGETRTIVLPTEFHSLFSSGQAKGLMIYTTSTSQISYGAFDDTVKITFYYT